MGRRPWAFSIPRFCGFPRGFGQLLVNKVLFEDFGVLSWALLPPVGVNIDTLSWTVAPVEMAAFVWGGNVGRSDGILKARGATIVRQTSVRFGANTC